MSKVVSLDPECHSLGQSALRQWGIEYEPDQQHVSRALKALGLTGAKGVATPGTDDVGGPKSSQINELRRMGKWHDPPRFNFLAMDRPDPLFSVQELMRKKASPRAKDLIALKRVAR